MTPMTQAVFHVLLALTGGARHGYAIMQDVRDHTDGALRLGAGTLYGTIDRLIRDGYVREVDGPAAESSRDARRRFYRITPDGRRALDAEVDRLERIVKTARTIRKAVKA
jgi:DNA-binding PadR family transcriptional regulator